MTSAEYREKFGHDSLASEEYRNKRSKMSAGENNPMYGKRWEWTEEQKENIRGRTAHNKGVPMSEEQKKKLSEKAIARNKYWHETGTHPICGTYEEKFGPDKANEIKKKLSDANKGKTRSPEAIEKARQSWLASGPHPAPMKGKKHTPETLEKLSKAGIETNKKKTAKAIEGYHSRLATIGYKLLGTEGAIATIECDQGHVFTRTRQYLGISKFKAEMCPICHPPKRSWVSMAETELLEFIQDLGINVYQSVRNVIHRELDLYIPDYNLAIEHNGLFWHSDEFKSKTYHLEKTEACDKKGIQLLHIFEDEWHQKTDIVKSRIMSTLGKNQKIGARKCEVKLISSKDASQFLNENHLQGRGRANVHIGLFHNDELVSVMTFLKNDISKSLIGWEMNRFASKLNINVVGGASKLFKFFVEQHNPDKIISFADRRWSTGGLYYSLGFDHVSNTPPNYWYFLPNEYKRTHRFALRKPKGSELTEKEIREQQGYSRIWDCGSLKFMWSS